MISFDIYTPYITSFLCNSALHSLRNKKIIKNSSRYKEITRKKGKIPRVIVEAFFSDRLLRPLWLAAIVEHFGGDDTLSLTKNLLLFTLSYVLCFFSLAVLIKNRVWESWWGRGLNFFLSFPTHTNSQEFFLPFREYFFRWTN